MNPMQPMHNIPARGGLNYDETPFLAIWEVTQSCDLACKHCRAAAQPIAHPDQLSTEEGKRVIDQIADMHIPIFVFTGGDPLKRPDLYELIRYSAEKGVKVAVTPSATRCPRTMSAAACRSVRRLLVQEPMKTRLTGSPASAIPGSSPM